MKIVSGNSNAPLARDIAKYLNVSLVEATIKKFPDKEIFVEIQENVRGEDVFVIWLSAERTVVVVVLLGLTIVTLSSKLILSIGSSLSWENTNETVIKLTNKKLNKLKNFLLFLFLVPSCW